MGTSSSNAGPGKGVPFDPPWLDQIENPGIPLPVTMPPAPVDATPNSQESDIPDGSEHAPIQIAVELAPERRFNNARRSLGNFIRTGSSGNFRKAVGHYSRTGMGGARNLARRMRLSTKTAAGLVTFFQDVRKGSDSQYNQWLNSLATKHASVQEVMDEIIRQVTSNGGSIDENSCQDSITKAIAELIETHPEIDLLNMNDNDIWTVVKTFLGKEACNRLRIDIGQIFESSKINPRDGVLRANEMQDYLIQEISVQIELLRNRTANPNPGQLEILLQEALKNTFTVYEGTL